MNIQSKMCPWNRIRCIPRPHRERERECFAFRLAKWRYPENRHTNFNKYYRRIQQEKKQKSIRWNKTEMRRNTLKSIKNEFGFIDLHRFFIHYPFIVPEYSLLLWRLYLSSLLLFPFQARSYSLVSAMAVAHARSFFSSFFFFSFWRLHDAHK